MSSLPSLVISNSANGVSMVAAHDKEKALKSQVKDFLLQSKQVESVKWALGMLSNRKKHESFDTSI